MQFSFLKVALIYVLISVVKADIVAFSGSTCDGDQGDNVPCDGDCIDFDDRHSYRVLSGGSHCVTYFLNSDCTVNVGSTVNPGNGACSNVNTGTAVRAIRCSPNAVCQVSRAANSTAASAIPPSESTTIEGIAEPIVGFN